MSEEQRGIVSKPGRSGAFTGDNEADLRRINQWLETQLKQFKAENETLKIRDRDAEAIIANEMEKVKLLRQENARLREAIREFIRVSFFKQDADGWMEITLRTEEFQPLRKAISTEGEPHERT